MKFSALIILLSLIIGVAAAREVIPDPDATNAPVRPRIVTEPVKHDTDDPAIWINRADPAASLILGTDKDLDGALVVFGLDGRIRHELSVRGLVRPNNVDVAYDVMIGGRKTDIAVVTERHAHRLRVYRLPDMVPVDGGGIPVFAGQPGREAMGIALYTRPDDGAVFAIVSRAEHGAPRHRYLHQYRLVDDGTGVLRGVFARAFGEWSGVKEIEAVAVDAGPGYVYFADERHAVRKYAADPAADDAEDELALIGRTGFAHDREGISVYPLDARRGYLIISNQQADTFRIFPREGTAGHPHDHPLLASVRLSTLDSDGHDVTATELPGFPGGLLVAMSTDRTFHYYAWADIAAAAGLETAPRTP